MDDTMRETARTAARKHALLNAVKHGTDPEVGAVMGPLMGENPDLRQHADDVSGVVAAVVSEVGDLSPDARRAELSEIAPDELADIEAENEADGHPLPDLPNADGYGEIRMRAAPNPNGPWHIGHGRMPAVIGTYRDRYDGIFILRFDDTDPAGKRPDPDAYDWIREAIAYLGFEYDEEYLASDRLETYYEHARNLIDAGGAYTCSCPAGEFSELKAAGDACPHREKEPATVHDEFQGMVDGEYDPGDLVLRVRTDLDDPNPALRDWVAFRMIDETHPRTEAGEIDGYDCWPLLDFQSGIDDHLTGVTHIIRGIDLQDSAKRQQYVYDYFDWSYPEVIHWGYVQVRGDYDVPLSTSTIRERIETGDLDGWDDPRAPTIASLRRRGIRGAAITETMVALGTSTNDIDLSMSSLYANNREIVDAEADRYFLVRDGVERPVVGGPEVATPPVHPEFEDRGRREIPVADTVLLEPDDVPDDGERAWLKGYGPVRADGAELSVIDLEVDTALDEDVPFVHWVPADDTCQVRLRTVTGDVTGLAEPGSVDATPGSIVQFERVGYARVDRHDDETVAHFTHR
ncbi:glutamate--tRNA ligase [Halobacteriales archaeon SW_7_68_16]|nr:MAG: glutamate--tRNA ligase [Halobacteriales archaeon SW_7_68_16]